MDQNIKSINSSTVMFIKKEYGYILWCIPTLFVVSLWAGIYVFHYRAFIFFLFAPILPLVILWTHTHNKIRQKFFKEYSQSLNFQYIGTCSSEKFEGSLFKAGHSRRVFNLIEGKIGDEDTKIFDYSYITGSGKHRKTHFFTIIEVSLHSQLPYLILKERGFDLFNIGSALKIKNPKKLKLEGDFNNYFSLEAEKEFEIEVLQIFTPDLMTLLCDKWCHLSIETSDDRIYIYENRLIDTKDELDSIVKLSMEVIYRISNIKNHLSKDVLSLRTIINQNDQV
jgi:hypothetical protein